MATVLRPGRAGDGDEDALDDDGVSSRCRFPRHCATNYAAPLLFFSNSPWTKPGRVYCASLKRVGHRPSVERKIGRHVLRQNEKAWRPIQRWPKKWEAFPAPRLSEIRASFPAPRQRENVDDVDDDDDDDVFR